MIFGDRAKEPKVMIVIAMVTLAIGAALPWLFQATSRNATDLFDGLRGLAVGIAIGFIILSAKRGGLQRREGVDHDRALCEALAAQLQRAQIDSKKCE